MKTTRPAPSQAANFHIANNGGSSDFPNHAKANRSKTTGASMPPCVKATTNSLPPDIPMNTKRTFVWLRDVYRFHAGSY